MTRPVPLFSSPELVTLLQAGPLDGEETPHARYLRDTITGDVLLVGGSSTRLARLVDVAGSSPNTTSVTARLNETSKAEEVRTHTLDLDDSQQYDTVVYTKESTGWCGRSKDFQRLTPLAKPNGTILAKSKWVPDSKRLSLEEIAVAGAYQYRSPSVYLRFKKRQTNLGEFNVTQNHRDDPSPESGQNAVDQALTGQTKRCRTQFQFSQVSEEFSPGWSWHNQLRGYARSWTQQFDAPVVNLCTGTNPFGDIRVDILREFTTRKGETRETAANLQADGMSVPLKRDSVSAVIMDPPWKIEPKTRANLFSEAQRIVQPGGRILHNSWWIPHHPYARPSEIRPVIANVTEDSLGGPGGLSFLTEYVVAEQPDYGAATYTLSAHLETSGLEHTHRYRDTRPAPPWEVPANDPRLVSPGGDYNCDCGCARFRAIPKMDLFECCQCGFRWHPQELTRVVSGASDPIEQQLGNSQVAQSPA